MYEGFLAQHQGQLEIARWRREEAKRLRELRRIEQTDPSYIAESRSYLNIPGFRNFLADIMNSVDLPKRLLDIGIGKGDPLLEVVQDPTWKDKFLFEGSGIMWHDEMKRLENLGVKIHITAAELLRGIAPSAFGGIMSFEGIAFSGDPEETIRRVHNKLSPGGLLIASFKNERGAYRNIWKRKYRDWKYLGHKRFSRVLQRQYGYDTEVIYTPEDDILLARKPNHEKHRSVKELLRV